VLESPTTLGLTAYQVGLAGTLYLAGAIGGALLFGYLTDRLGRKRLFTVTLGIYLAGAVLTACAWDFWSFVLFRVVTGMAIGGEYSAINSAIDEFIPALMLAAATIELVLGVASERKALEDVAAPLTTEHPGHRAFHLSVLSREV